MDENQALAAFCKAMSVCPVHRHYVFADTNTMLLPPIRHKQYKFFEGNGQYGAITWALLSKEAAKKHVINRVPLDFYEWRSGEDLWIISLIGYRIKPKLLIPQLAASFREATARYIRRDQYMRPKTVVTINKNQGRLSCSKVGVHHFLSP